MLACLLPGTPNPGHANSEERKMLWTPDVKGIWNPRQVSRLLAKTVCRIHGLIIDPPPQLAGIYETLYKAITVHINISKLSFIEKVKMI